MTVADESSSDLATWSLKDVVETTPSSMAMFDTEMRYLAVSRQYLRDNKINETPRSIIGRSVFDFRRDSERAREVNRRALAGETITKDDFCFRRPDGTVLWMRYQMQPWRLPDGRIGGVLLFMEITQARKEAEERLAANESLLRLSQEAGHIGSYDWDIGGGHNYWSDEQCRLHGIEPSGGKSIPIAVWRQVIHPDDLAAVESKIREIIERGGSAEIEHRIVRPDGVRWLYGRGQIVREEGKPTRLIGINMDITERRALEDNLRELTRTLEERVQQEVAAREAVQAKLAHTQKIRSIGELTGGIAHDFNNILTVITGTIDILAEGVADDPELAAIARAMSAAADRGAKLTSSLLAFGRKQPLRPRSTDVASLIGATRELLQSTLGRQIEIDCRLKGDVGRALIDPDQLTAALVNLGINARDAMPDGGQIVIGAEAVVLGKPAAEARDIAQGRYVCISLADTGCGIEDAIRDRIYEPFFSTKGVGKGTGLGLSMVYGFLKQSGGHIEFESEIGKGTTFTIYLPATAQASGNEQINLPSIQRGDDIILCVEDDFGVRELVVRQLQSLGYRTLIASNAAEALEVVRTDARIDLIFTDIIMPGAMNGWKLAEQVRAIRPEMKFLYTTGYSHPGAEGLAKDAPILKKPYRLPALAAMIRQAIDRAAS
jgi:PAS domain S-box-containing protein